jgi:hypothetical protein
MFGLIFKWPRRKTALELLQAPFTCASCGELHRGPHDMAFMSPWHWEGPIEPEPNDALRMDGDFLSNDLCVIGGRDFFVRGSLYLRVEGLADCVAFGCWSTLSRANFELNVDHWEDPDRASLGPWSGWFSNAISHFPDLINQPCTVYPAAGGYRPEIVLENPDHPLARAQADGISAEELLEVYRAQGHIPTGS